MRSLKYIMLVLERAQPVYPLAQKKISNYGITEKVGHTLSNIQVNLVSDSVDTNLILLCRTILMRAAQVFTRSMLTLLTGSMR